MAIRSKVAKHLKFLQEMMQPPVQKIKACEKLLERHFSLCSKNKQLTEDEITAYLIKRDQAAKRIATSIHAIDILKKNKLPDSIVTHDEILNYQNKQLIKLKQHALETEEIIRKTTFSFPVAASIKIVSPNIAEKLNDLIKSIEIHIKKNAKLPNRKKAIYPHRADAIKALTLAWVEMTSLPPEKLKRTVEQESYGRFHNFMEDSLKLFHTRIHTEEAIKESVRYYKESLS